jgi:hypothetical protein
VAEPTIIVEGPDGSGKTDLAHRIAAAFNRDYRRPPPEALSSTRGPAAWLADWWDGQLALHPNSLAHGVYDRCFYISDPIYQQAQVNRDLLMDGKQLAAGIARLWSVEPVIIFCLPPFNVQLANVNSAERERLEGVDDQALLKIDNAYWAAYAWVSQALFENVMLFDYTEEGSWERLTSKLPV